MTTVQEAVCSVVMKKLESLSFLCNQCPRISQCECQGPKGEPRYCEPMIRAALLGDSLWTTTHRSAERS